MSVHTCQARSLSSSFVIPHTTIECGTTKECCAPASQKVFVDEGDAYLYICADHLQKFKRRTPTETLGWLGWFDGTIPSNAHVKYSAWFWQTVLEVFRVKYPQYKDAYIPPGPLRVWFEKELQNMNPVTSLTQSMARLKL